MERGTKDKKLRFGWFRISKKQPSSAQALSPSRSPSDLEQHFRTAELEKSRLFDTSLRELEYDFLQQEGLRRQAGQQRQRDFAQAQSRRREQFNANEKLRLDPFHQAQIEQEGTFQANEQRRRALFQSSEDARKKVFEESLEKYSRQSEWIFSILEPLYSSGRRRREDAFRKLLDNITKEFNALHENARDTARVAHLLRVEVLKTYQCSPVSDSKMVPYSSTPAVNPSRPSSYVYRSDDQIMIPVALSPVITPSTRSRPDQEQHSSRPSTIISRLSPEPMPQAPALREPLCATGLDEINVDDLSSFCLPLRDQFGIRGSLARRKEKERVIAFRDALQAHKDTFSTGEDARWKVVADLETKFLDQEQKFMQQFKSSQDSFWGLFRYREKHRNEAEVRRDKIAVKLWEVESAQAKSSLSIRIRSLEQAEAEIASSLKDQVSETLSAMEQTIRDSRAAQDELFTRAILEYRPAALPSHDSYERVHSPAAVDRIHRDGGGSSGSSSHSHGRAHRPVIRVPVPHAISPSHETSFVPGTLLHPNVWVSELPIPEEQQPTTDQVDSTANMFLRMHRALFAEEESRRKAWTHQTFEKWQQIFAINESKRQAEFQALQTDHTNRSEERENHQSLTFLSDQKQRSAEFSTGELLRESLFWEKDEQRSHQFVAFLNEWQRSMDEAQESAIIDAHKGEIGRDKALAGWMITIRGEFLDKMASWEDSLAYDEWNREQRFKAALKRTDDPNLGPPNSKRGSRRLLKRRA